MKIFLSVIVLTIFLLSNINTAQSLKSPEEFLGYKVGTDYKIADYETIQKYFKHLGENSKMIVYEEIGKTVQNRNMFMAVLSSEDNIKNLSKYQNIVKRLSDPRTISDLEAKQLSIDGKVVVLVTCNIHSTEIASAQMSMELCYNLITSKAPEKVNEALNNVIFI
ncbi:MAG TPA: M14 family zinc carboxypeptidase, partial [Ignavibacteriaceae bacterium]